MTRAPLAAWRRLYALGGAPAASHAALARTPVAPGLLQPWPGMTITRDASFATLTRPIDLAGLFARVSRPSPEAASEPPVRAQVGRPMLPGEPMAPTQRTGPSAVDASLARSPRTPGDEIAKRRAIPMPRVERTGEGKAIVDTVALQRHEHPTPPSELARRGPTLPTALTDAIERASAARPTSNEAQRGAASRILVDAPLDQVERLLSADSPPRGNPSRAPAAQPETGTSALVDRVTTVVERIDARGAAAASVTAPQPRGNQIMPLAVSDARTSRDTLASTDTTQSGGFRGLALRTLDARAGVRAPADRRLEPERRLAVDLVHDNLDTAVADSLARVLEREARRHGIDLTETGA